MRSGAGMGMGMGRAVVLAAVSILFLGSIPTRSESGVTAEQIDALLIQARDAAGRDDHLSAIESYERAIALDPEIRESVALPLAAQRTWNGDYDAAIRELRSYVRTHSPDMEARLLLALTLSWNDDPQEALATYRAVLVHEPDNRDARLGEARMLAWTGSSRLAARRYGEILERHPDWIDARLGQALSYNWGGDHRRAAGIYRAILEDEGTNTDAWTGLATAYRWDGRADRAILALREMESRGTATRESRSLARAIDTDWKTRTDAGYDVAKDSDDFETRTLRVATEIPWRYRAHLRAALSRRRYLRPGDPSGDETWISGGFDYRVADTWQISGDLDIATSPLASSSTTPWTSNAILRFLPHDRVRGDLGYSRLSHFSYDTFPERIAADQVGGSLSIRLGPVWTLVGQGDWTRYEDDNERRSRKAFASWLARPRGPRLRVEAGVHEIDHNVDRANGVWTPQDYRALFARANAEVALPVRFLVTIDLDGGLASDRVQPDRTAYLSYAGGLVRSFRVVRLELRAGQSESNLETGRGYRRSFASMLATVGL